MHILDIGSRVKIVQLNILECQFQTDIPAEFYQKCIDGLGEVVDICMDDEGEQIYEVWLDIPIETGNSLPLCFVCCEHDEIEPTGKRFSEEGS